MALRELDPLTPAMRLGPLFLFRYRNVSGFVTNANEELEFKGSAIRNDFNFVFSIPIFVKRDIL